MRYACRLLASGCECAICKTLLLESVQGAGQPWAAAAPFGLKEPEPLQGLTNAPSSVTGRATQGYNSLAQVLGMACTEKLWGREQGAWVGGLLIQL